MRAAKRRGLTLMEVAVSMAIIAIAVVPAATMWQRASEANQATEEQAKALILAQLKIESQVRVVPFADQKSASGTDAESGLRWNLTVTDVSPTLKRSKVSVLPATGTDTLLELETLTAKEL